jgi:uncharacterized protein YkwD
MSNRAIHPRLSRLIALAVAAVLALLAAGSAPDLAAAGTACTKYGEVRAEKLRNRQARASIRCFLNRERKQRGIGKLDNDRRLQRAAQKHTEVMVNKGCFSHECPGEASLEARLRSVDYLIGGLIRWTFGENIAYGTDSYGTPKAMVKAWMKSPPHRANILNPAFKDVGVGFKSGTPGARKADGGTYTTDLGMRLLD